MARELLVRLANGSTQTISLRGSRLTVGRAPDNDLAYPDDPLMSRYHLSLESGGEDWTITDLGSKNGTLLNGERLAGRRILRPGDFFIAGRLVFSFHDPTLVPQLPPEDDNLLASTSSTSILTSFDAVAEQENAGLALDASASGRARIQALLSVGRELSDHKPLGELFPAVLELAVKSVGATRGALMTVENGQLTLQAFCGEGLRLSRAVTSRVVNERASLLVVDTGKEEFLKGSDTIVLHRVRSLIAVPLQTEGRVTGLIYVDSPDLVRPFTAEDLNLLTVMANVAAIRIENARLAEVEQHQRQMSQEMAQAAEIQRGLMPRQDPVAPGLDSAGQSLPCLAVGGDYFDYVPMPGGSLGVLVGDVSGKGLPAALLMSSLQARVQVLAEETEDMTTLMTRLNRSICSTCPGNRFITLFMARANPATGHLAYSNAGHNPPLLFRASGRVEQLDTGGPVLGILKNMSYQAATTVIEPGDRLLLYTDGVTEALNPQDQEYGEQRLLNIVARHPNSTARTIVQAVLADVTDFTQGRPAVDDITLVVLRRQSA
jgi:serine phosphatase RsbU (regulator of sigma subunit)